MPINGNVLALSLETDSEILASELIDAKKNEDVQNIAFHAIAFDDTITGAFLELLRHNDRDWKSVELINCRGEVDRAISLALSINRLESLHIVRNIELFDGYRILGEGLEATKSLKKLRLTSTVGQVDAVLLSAGLVACRSLEVAELQYTVFEEGSIQTLASVGLAGNKSLKSIDFFGCDLGDEELYQIFSSLAGHPTLQCLVLHGNKCGVRGSKEVAAMLLAKGCALQKLDLSFQRLDGGKTLDIVPLTEALISNVSLQILYLTGNGLDDDAAERIARAVIDNKTVRELYLARNKFTDIGVTAIAQTLPRMVGLKKLSLWGNPFGEEGARELLNGMVQNLELCDLHLFRQFKCSDQIQYFTNINRGGRKLLQEPPNEVPMSLWPLVLERANTMKMPPRRKEQENENARIDMLYCLIRGPVLFARGFDLGC
jgi:Ran GTPase-activating protein (RanGAP) involved in mRNA processing and transport